MDKNEAQKYLKGTTTVGIVCSDGVVIGADTRATWGTLIANSETRKIFKIDNNLGLTVAGTVGDAQEIIRILRAHNEIYKMNEGRPLSPKSANSLLSIILQGNKMYPYMVQLIIAGLDGDEPQIYNMDPIGGYTIDTGFSVTGSGTEIAMGYLEDSYKKGMPTKDGLRIVARALQMAIRRNSATGDGMIIAAITKSGYAEYSGKELEKVLGAK
jgi:proteasome beta subunit